MDRLAELKWEEVESYYLLTVFILISVFARLVIQSFPCISSRVPESCVLIVLGILFGLILLHVDDPDTPKFPQFSPSLFFYVLLPPIILESAFSLHNKVFFENIGAVLLYAVVGTALNFVLIGVFLILIQEIKHLLWTEELLSHQPTYSQILLFSSLISAVGRGFSQIIKQYYIKSVDK